MSLHFWRNISTYEGKHTSYYDYSVMLTRFTFMLLTNAVEHYLRNWDRYIAVCIINDDA